MEHSKLTVITRETSDAFITVGTAIARDGLVSGRARGVWLTVMSLPPDWDFSLKGLSKIMKESIFAIRTSVTELIETGYVTRIRRPDPFGGSCVEYIFRHTPVRGHGNGDLGNGDLTKRPQSIESSNLEIQEKEEIASSPEQEPKTKKTRQKRLEVPLPDDFELTPKMREWAVTHLPSTFNIDEAFERFKDTARSKAWRYADWEAHWRNSMRNLVKWAAEAEAKKNGSTVTQGGKITYQGRALGEVR